MWKTIKLGELATFVNGYAFKPSDWGNKGLPIIRIQNLTKSSKEINYYSGDINEKYFINDGDILISWSASLGVYEWNEGKALLNQHIFKVVFDKVKVDKKFFVYAIKKEIKNMIRNTHGSTMKHITKKRFNNLPIKLPPLQTQKKIVEVLDKAQELIDERKQQIKLLDDLIQSVFYDMFGDPVANSKGWEVKKLGEVGDLQRGKSKHRPRNDPELLGGQYPLVQTGDIANAGIYLNSYTQTYSEIGLKQSKMWKKGTLCITIAANIAKTSILGFDACFPDSIVAFLPTELVNNMYIQIWFGFLQSIIEASAPESAQKNINLKILNNLDILVPPIDLQNQFAQKVQKIEQQKEHMQQSLTEMENNFNSLMQRAFKGDL